jgi:N-acyl-phosphatidylethanolamine-hydrolysing phospholipase D
LFVGSTVDGDAGDAEQRQEAAACKSGSPAAPPYSTHRTRMLPSLSRALRAFVPAVMLTPAGLIAGDAPPPIHHRDDGFQNTYTDFAPAGLGALLKWKADGARQGLPRPPLTPTPKVKPDLTFVHANATAGAAMQPAITWIGHATMLVQFGGLNVLTDRTFSERASPFNFLGPKRQVAPGLALAELPHIDVVLISHNHYDHLDERSVRALNAQAGGPPLFVVPLGNKPWLVENGIATAVELDWWQAHTIGSMGIVLTPVQHWSGRGLADRLKTLWGGYAVFAPDLHLFFGGDTAYSKDFADIRARVAARQGAVGFDFALLPIGGYEPRWFMASQHIDPAEAVQIHIELAARRSVGVHWGTFELTDESLDEPPRSLALARQAKGIADEDFFVLAIGETRKLPRRPR